jgi:hypothetical protein
VNIEQLKPASNNSLRQLLDLLSQLSEEQYASCFPLLSGNSIGKHYRHVIELYQEFFNGHLKGKINYDQRKRNLQLETDINQAILAIKDLISLIESLQEDRPITVCASFADENLISLPSSISRELAYNLEHAIHHMAIVQICVKHYYPFIQLSPDFGLAYSTIKFNQSNVHAHLPTLTQ